MSTLLSISIALLILGILHLLIAIYEFLRNWEQKFKCVLGILDVNNLHASEEFKHHISISFHIVRLIGSLG